MARNQLFLRFDGEGTVANIRGASLLKGRQHADTTLVVDHAAGDCQSREVFKTVLDDESRGVFQGKIIVRPHAQKTDAKMTTHALLLSEDAEADNKPELEIFADDVQCGHGATAGALDEDLLFYLMARGIPQKEAEALLIQAFVGEAIEGIEHAGLREALIEAVARVAEGAELSHASRGQQRHLRRRRASARISRSCRCRSTASRWSISTTPPRRRSRRPCSTACSRPTRPNTPTCIAACIISPMPRPKATRARARRCARSSTRSGRKRSSSPATPPRRSTSSPTRSARERIKPGDEIVLSIMEHHSNIVPWHFLRERQGAVIKWAPVDDDGNFLLDEFEKLLTPRTKMVAITHMSNALGTIVPIKEVVRLAHARGIPVLVDGSQGAVHLDVDVQDLDCDFYVFTGHKLYGPTGIGVLYGKYEQLAAMPPFNGGGEMIRDVFEDRVTYGEPPHRFEAGTPPIVQAIGLGAAIDYVQSIGKARIRAHEDDARRLRARAAAARSTRCASSAPRRTRARSSPSR